MLALGGMHQGSHDRQDPLAGIGGLQQLGQCAEIEAGFMGQQDVEDGEVGAPRGNGGACPGNAGGDRELGSATPQHLGERAAKIGSSSTTCRQGAMAVAVDG